MVEGLREEVKEKKEKKMEKRMEKRMEKEMGKSKFPRESKLQAAVCESEPALKFVAQTRYH